MKAVIQRVSQASVEIEKEVVGKIDTGFMILLGIHEEDKMEDVSYLVRKISKMRIFEDEAGKMNLDLAQVHGSILSISQFTLYADTKKGNRPSFITAARPEQAIPLYEAFNEGLREAGFRVETGEFGATMQVQLINDGPVTIVIDTRDKGEKVCKNG
ncbi:MAG: D-tyrosyl-tRNA(Tyr) deacylase [Lactobacillales bacterium]|jgi:D-tyrosyl-tRNA(Tyr) deacylase|nr:D-tyrosyl-tRNA(Tyr) deacylase [Lactobacillales bacterium]